MEKLDSLLIFLKLATLMIEVLNLKFEINVSLFFLFLLENIAVLLIFELTSYLFIFYFFLKEKWIDLKKQQQNKRVLITMTKYDIRIYL